MSIFPQQFFTQPQVLLGSSDKYKSNLVARKFAGVPKGAYVGFTPSVSPPSPILTLSTDPTEGFSLLNVPSNVDPAGVTIVVDTPITLDFTGQPGVDFPMHVLARASYIDDEDSPTTAEIFTRSASAVSFNEVLLCVVDGGPAALSIAFDPALNERDVPQAFPGVNFGFMPAGSVELLQAATDTVNEVVAARVGLDGAVHPDLSTRLAADQSAESMAGRLSLNFNALRSNDYAVVAGAETVNVSGSFTEIDRDHNPKVTLDGTGSETSVGAVAESNDPLRNVCLLQNANSGYRPIDDPVDRRIIFGRLSGPLETPIGGTWTFDNANKNVVGTDGNATTDLQVGDTLQGADGKFYEIGSILTDNSIELRTAYTGPDGSSPTLISRRWTLRLTKIDASNVEVTASLPTPETLRFFAPVFLTMAESNFDYSMTMHSSSERAVLGDATDTVPGVVRLANTGTLLGAIDIQNAGVPLGGGPFHTINFTAPNASVIPAIGVPGEVEVAEIGIQGLTGPTGPSGGPGPPGGTGPGFSVFNSFEVSSEFAGTPGATTPFSFTRDMGHNIRYLHGNAARFRDGGEFSSGLDRLDIGDVTAASATEGRISGTIGGAAGDVFLVAFLSSAGD